MSTVTSPVASTAVAPAGTATGTPERVELQKLAQEFESVLLLQVMRQVRQTITSVDGDTADEGDALGGNMSAMNDTIDGELSRFLSQAGGFGLSSFLTRSWSRGNTSSAPSAATTGAALPADTAAAGIGSSSAGSADMTVTPSSTPPPTPEPRTDAAPEAHARNGVAVAQAGAVTSAYGWRTDPIEHTKKFHGGVDIRAAYGQAVPAAADGRVVLARVQGDYGMTVVVAHANGFQTRYAHLSSLNVAEGDTVVNGQTVGRIGQSGRATGPHLHFELIRDGQRVDPTAGPQASAFKKSVARADSTFAGPSDIGTSASTGD